MAQYTPSPIWVKDQWAKLRAKEAQEMGLPPYGNTGGKFKDRTGVNGREPAKIDWLNLSVPGEVLDVPFPDLAGSPKVQWLQNLQAHLRDLIGESVELLEAVRGLHGFSNSASVVLRDQHGSIELGKVAWGGAAQKGRVFISLSGTCTGMVKDWQYVKEWAAQKNAKITRLDIAVDFDGEVTIEQAVQAYRDGEYTTGGNMPSHNLVGDWLTEGSPKGRTLYVGKKENGKELCIYEKGKQLGDKLSNWLRIEARFLAKDRLIPLDALIDPMPYWRGAAPFLQRISEGLTQKIETAKRVAQQTMKTLISHAQNAYGRLVDVLMDCTGEDAEQVVSLLRRAGCPRSVRHPLAAVGFHNALPEAALI